MAHPADILGRQSLKQGTIVIQLHNGLAVFPFRSTGDLAPQHVHHQLAAVADAQNRNAPGIDFRINGRSIRQIDTVGTSGKNNALGILGADGGKRGAIRVNLAINIAFANATRNQLVILATKVNDNNSFLLHGLLLSFSIRF